MRGPRSIDRYVEDLSNGDSPFDLYSDEDEGSYSNSYRWDDDLQPPPGWGDDEEEDEE